MKTVPLTYPVRQVSMLVVLILIILVGPNFKSVRDSSKFRNTEHAVNEGVDTS